MRKNSNPTNRKKPFSVVSSGIKLLPARWRRDGITGVTLGQYETRARAEQALRKFSSDWSNCLIKKNQG